MLHNIKLCLFLTDAETYNWNITYCTEINQSISSIVYLQLKRLSYLRFMMKDCICIGALSLFDQ